MVRAFQTMSSISVRFTGFCVVIAISLSLPNAVLAQPIVLESPPDARTEAMGRAFSVLDRGPFSAWGNVGGLGFAEGFQVSGSWVVFPGRLADVTDYYASALYSANVGGRNLVVDANLTGFGYNDDSIFPYGVSRSESVFGLASGFRLNRYLGVGIGLKRISVQPGLDRSANPIGNPQIDDVGPAFDGGLLALVPVSLGLDNPASVDLLGGFTIRNAGPGLQREYGGDEALPWEVVLGLGGEFRSGCDRGFEARGLALPGAPFLSFSAGGSVRSAQYGAYYERNRYETNFMGGAEASLRKVFFVRAGYMTEEIFDNNGWTWGGGLAIRDRVGFDVARTFQFGERERVTKLSLWLRIPSSPDGSD